MKKEFLLRNSRLMIALFAGCMTLGSYLNPTISLAQIPTPAVTLYNDPDRTIQKNIFERGDIVYAKATNLNMVNYYQFGVYVPAPRSNVHLAPTNCQQAPTGQLLDMYQTLQTSQLSYGVPSCPGTEAQNLAGNWLYRMRTNIAGCIFANELPGTQINTQFRLAQAYAYRTATARNTAAMDACESTGNCASALPRLYFCPGDEAFLRIRGFYPCRTNVAYSLIKPDGTVLPAVLTTTNNTGNLSVNYLIPNDATASNIGLWQIRIGLTDGGVFISRFTVDLDLFNVRGNTIFAHKFYDADLNGIKGTSEPWLEGWKMDLTGDATDTKYTSASGWATFANLGDGDYTVTEGSLPNWIPTGPTFVDMNFSTESCGEHREPIFGNVCIGGGTDAKSKGFWGNKNGLAIVTSGDLCRLNNPCLRKLDGSHFDPNPGCPVLTGNALKTAKNNFDAWLQAANGSNMAYMLSAQLAAMALNAIHMGVDPNALIYAPGTDAANVLGFATVAAIIQEANTLLCTGGANLVINGTHTDRARAAALSSALDKANTNQNYLQDTPCDVEFLQNGDHRVAQTQSQTTTLEGLTLATYPNPLTERTTVSYTLPEAANVSLIVYDGFGKQVAVLHNGEQAAGQYNEEWNAKDLAAGMYFCRLVIDANKWRPASSDYQNAPY